MRLSVFLCFLGALQWVVASDTFIITFPQTNVTEEIIPRVEEAITSVGGSVVHTLSFTRMLIVNLPGNAANSLSDIRNRMGWNFSMEQDSDVHTA
ncbi:uncharacterized protein Ecym_6397 [Eremothecium cymbalariae DBVPG|uniref:Inhibitor I9 domain-containing protein n=1 Tax=Eremothecium cymbalariae (strain CBS 270.75 / DBVPG 7215 / KCTC 17166 / NRRL Y-17582) TaxID=931890 RepID=G8JUJ1_ERECY|nr:hypothetical protein Ecym_6397 [Eremothecium cymbalariae DBVPG\